MVSGEVELVAEKHVLDALENTLKATYRVTQGAYSFTGESIGTDKVSLFMDLIWTRHGDSFIAFKLPSSCIRLNAFWHCIRRLRRTSLYECFLEIASCNDCKLAVSVENN